MSEYDKAISGYYTADGNAKSFSLPFAPDWIEVKIQGNASGDNWESTANPGVVKEAYWYRGMAQGSALTTKNTNSAATDTKDFLTSGGISTFVTDPALLGPALTGSGAGTITNAAPPVVTVAATTGLSDGDTVLITQSTGALQISSIPFTIDTVTGTTFELAYMGAPGSAATNVVARKVLYPEIFTPKLRYITSVTTGATTTVTFSTTHGYVVGQTLRFHCASEFGMVQLSDLQGKVLSVNTGTNSVVVDIDSTSFTAFAFPTSAVASNGVTFPHACPIGEQADQFDAAFVDNGTYGMLFGSAIAGPNGALVLWKAGLSSKVYTSQ